MNLFLKAANTSLSVVMIFYAILAAIGAVLGLFLPETKGREIPDTIEEAENLHNFEMKTIKTIENSWTQNFLLNKFSSFDSSIFRYYLKLNSNNYKKFLLKSKKSITLWVEWMFKNFFRSLFEFWVKKALNSNIL